MKHFFNAITAIVVMSTCCIAQQPAIFEKLLTDSYGIVLWNSSHLDLNRAASRQIIMNRSAIGLQYQFTFGKDTIQVSQDSTVDSIIVDSMSGAFHSKYTRIERRYRRTFSKVGTYRVSLSSGYQHYYNFTLGDDRFLETSNIGAPFVAAHFRLGNAGSYWIVGFGLSFPSLSETAITFRDAARNVATTLSVSSSTAFAPEVSIGRYVEWCGMKFWTDIGAQHLRLTGMSYKANDAVSLKDFVESLPSERRIISLYAKVGVSLAIH